ncbi:MAG: hypothetical protein AB7I38_01245 [Dehalococcoidia bacterium]
MEQDPRDRRSSPTITRRRFVVSAGSAAAAAAFLAACGSDDNGSATTEDGTGETAGFVFTDARGITVDLPERPVRVVAQVSAAAALWDFGIRPVAVFGPQRNEDGSNGPQVGEVDLSTTTDLGSAWGELDLEALAALKPDLLVSTCYAGADPLWYVPEDAVPIIESICPSVGIEV